MDITDFLVDEWVIVKWKSNNELGIITSIHPETNTLKINVNPYKFNKSTTIENFKNVIKLDDQKKEILKSLIEEVDSLEKKLSLLKEKIISWDCSK